MKYLHYLCNDYKNVEDLIIKKINGVNIVYFESLVSQDKINEFILKDLVKKKFLFSIKNNISAPKLEKLDDYEKLKLLLENGYTIIITNFNSYAVETRGNLSRSISTPETEVTLYGPKEAMIENFQMNLGLIKRRIKSDKLKNLNLYIGDYTKSLTSVLYISGITDIKLVKDTLIKLKDIKVDGITDINELKKYLSSNKILPTIKVTERPDLIARSLLNGKVVIIMDNSPFALILPGYLTDFIHPISDQYCNDTNINFIKILRILCLIISIITPGIYVALTTFNQEAIPSNLLLSIQAQRMSVPFPAFLECLITLITCEILRESDLRFPGNYGSAISILGALVLGEAAVSAGIVSPIMIIVVAVTYISSLIFTDLEIVNGIRYLRLFILLLSSLFGIFGFLVSILFMIIYLLSIETVNKPYLYPITPFDKKYLSETLLKIKERL